MVQKHGKCGLNNGATMKFGETNYLMKRQASEFYIRKLFTDGQAASGQSVLGPRDLGPSSIGDTTNGALSWELDSLRELEDDGGAGLPTQLLNGQRLVYVSLNKHKRWDLLEKLKDHLHFRRMFEEKLNNINSPVLGITLVEKYGDYLHGHKSAKDYCSYIRYESNMAAKEPPTESKGNAAFLWDLREQSHFAGTENNDGFKAKRSPSHNQHFRGVQRRNSADRKLMAQSCKNEKKSSKPLRTLQSNLGFQDGGPEVLYEVTYPRPLDASSGCQDLRVRRWNWSFRDKKSRSKCKGQKISRRADNYCLTQKELQDLNGDVDLDHYLFVANQQEPEDFEPVMLGDHIDEKKLCQLEETSHCVAEVTRSEITESRDGDECLTYRDPEWPWGTPFEMSMIKVDRDSLLEDEFEFLETPEEEVSHDEFEVVEAKSQTSAGHSVDGVLLVEKEDSGFIHVDSTSIINSPRQNVTLGDYIKPARSKRHGKDSKSKRTSKKNS